MGNLARRLKRLEALHRRASLPEAERRLHDRLERLSDRDFALCVQIVERVSERGGAQMCRDAAALVAGLEGEERRALEAYLATGAYEAELEWAAALAAYPEPQREQLRERFIEEVLNEPHFRAPSLFEELDRLRGRA